MNSVIGILWISFASLARVHPADQSAGAAAVSGMQKNSGGGVGGSVHQQGVGGGGGWSLGGCPRVCFCNTPSKIVYCSRRGLTSIPDDIATDSLQINLNGNAFESSVVRRVNLSRYTDLEHLYLSECTLESIEVGAFMDMANLKWLDLSNNRMKVIRDHTFDGLQLEHLFLNGNRNLALHAFSFGGLAVTGLYLHDCSLAAVQPELFQPLNTTLKYLWLNGNELERLSRRFADIFTGLLHLRLGFNPLNCNCEAAWLKDFYDRHGDMFKGAMAPSCLTPVRLKGGFFNELSASEFRCQMPMFTNVEAHFGSNQGKLKCGAIGEPVPSLYWIQPSGKATKFNPPSSPSNNNGGEEVTGDERQRIEGILSLNWADDGSLPSGMYICIANNEAGNVTLTINLQSPNRRISVVPAYTLRTDWGDGVVAPTHHPSAINNEVKINNIFEHHHNHVTSGTFTDRPPPPTLKGGVGGDPSAVNQVLSRHLGDSLSLRASSAGKQQPDVGGDGVGVVSVPIENKSPRYSLGNDGGEGAIAAGVEERLFTVSELSWAVVSTHVLTLFLCLIVLAALYRTRCCRSKYALVQLLQPCGGSSADRQLMAKREQRQQQMQLYAGGSSGSNYGGGGGSGGYGGGTHKSLTSSSRDDVTECVYLNGLRHHRLQSYTDSPNSIRR